MSDSVWTTGRIYGYDRWLVCGALGFDAFHSTYDSSDLFGGIHLDLNTVNGAHLGNTLYDHSEQRPSVHTDVQSSKTLQAT